MIIKIETKKIMVHRVPGRVITGISGVLSELKLPLEYLKSYPNCYVYSYDTNRIMIRERSVNYILEVKKCYTEKIFQELIDMIRHCGKRLYRINRKYPDVSDSWNGEEEFKI